MNYISRNELKENLTIKLIYASSSCWEPLEELPRGEPGEPTHVKDGDLLNEKPGDFGELTCESPSL